MTALIKYAAARAALAEAHSIDEVLEIRDKMEAVRRYGEIVRDTDLQRMAVEIKLRAEHRLGRLLIEMAASGAREDGPGRPGKTSQRATLKGLGITRDLSARAQASAKMPATAFEAYLASHTGDKMPSSSGLRSLIRRRHRDASNLRDSGSRRTAIAYAQFEAIKKPWDVAWPEAQRLFLNYINDEPEPQ